ncbi:unnamed protein product [Rotaria socialis]|uniref:Kazal-like domain-containing protein n=4 Tax=Rotaria socialis TaxID=392032 RepID=A0A820QA64_9BILA|nr:unnamed protein product [Rotaria socialis]CAF3276695.1 unnamed protein product [Rotaria socialis]CAF3449301.1 unnamed protein product [Rotaria socialis]CAF3731613.1 unnamed protein product [Rotaria socialis]CAF3791963.1 unnamed protein product [Rotaria socialis]
MNPNDDDDDGVIVDSSTKKPDEVSLSNKIIFIVICACNMIQNAIVGGSNNAIMTTLESGFYMTSTETGLFQSVYELVAIFTYPLVGYFGDRSRRKTRWIAISMGILSCGFLVMSFPHLLESKRGKPPLEPHVADHLTLCNPERKINVCSISSNLRFLSHLKYVFYLSNIINACGSAALPTLAVTFIEDLFPEEKAPIAQGIYYAVGGIGIGLGFLATSQFLKVYTYIKKPLWLTPVYSEWVGAWWLVYALGTCISLILCVTLCLFDIGRRRKYVSSSAQKEIQSTLNQTYLLLSASPMNRNGPTENNHRISSRTSSSETNLSSSLNVMSNELNGKQQTTSLDIVEEKCLTATATTTTTLNDCKDFLSDIYSLMKHLLLNLRYMGITCCAIVEALLIKGYLAFLSKHIEYQFRTTSSHSSVYIGVISLFSVIFGTPLGAYCVKRYDMNGRQCAKFCCIILAMSSVIFLGLLLHCREPTIGTSHSMPVISTAFDDDSFDELTAESDRVESPCKRDCKCDMNIYQPVCDVANRETYQNPCLLGCKTIRKGIYADCLCLPNNSTVNVGRCTERKCAMNFRITLCGAFIVVFMSCCVIVPALKCVLHSVELTHRAFSLGFKSTMTKTFGYLPGTLLFGIIIDRTCKTWIRETCGLKDQCKHYNNKRMAISLALLGCGFRSLSALFCAISWYAYIKKPDVEEKKKSIEQHSEVLAINRTHHVNV